MPDPPAGITALLHALSRGDADVFERLATFVYPNLERIARGRLRQGPPSTLRTGDLIHEMFLRFPLQNGAKDRKHFYCIVAKVMRSELLITAVRFSRSREVVEVCPLVTHRRPELQLSTTTVT